MEKTERQLIAAVLGRKGGETTAKRYTSEQLAEWGRRAKGVKKTKRAVVDKPIDKATDGI